MLYNHASPIESHEIPLRSYETPLKYIKIPLESPYIPLHPHIFIYHSLFVPSPWRLSYNEADTNEAAGASQPKGTSHGKNGGKIWKQCRKIWGNIVFFDVFS